MRNKQEIEEIMAKVASGMHMPCLICLMGCMVLVWGSFSCRKAQRYLKLFLHPFFHRWLLSLSVRMLRQFMQAAMQKSQALKQMWCWQMAKSWLQGGGMAELMKNNFLHAHIFLYICVHVSNYKTTYFF